MTADRDYYSGAFLDWFPGNIQHLDSITSVLQCPPAAQQQYNETAGIRHFCTLLPSVWESRDKHCRCYMLCSYVAEGKTE